MILYHGGHPGLDVGELLVPSAPHVEDGCPICAARVSGKLYTVRQARAWALSMGEAGVPMLRALEGADPNAPVDPPSEARAVYLTTHRLYATWYAARSRGDLYRVAPLGGLVRSESDHFPSFIAPAARVLEVLRRGVFLKRAERRELGREWRKADERVDRARRERFEALWPPRPSEGRS